MRIRVFLVALALVMGGWGSISAQPAPKKPIDIFRAARDFLQEGSIELAAESLRDFVNANPTEQDYLDIEAKYGATVFQSLRNVPRWLPDATKDAEFKKNVIDTIITGSLQANKKLVQNPNRLQLLVRNLGESREEREFAIAELNRAGDAVVPVLVENLRVNESPEYRAGALTAVTRLNASVVPGLVTATENLPDELKVGLIQALVARNDLLKLIGQTDTNFVPYLWYLASAETNDTLRQLAVDTLRRLTGDRSDRQQADQQLLQYARPLVNRKGNYSTFDRTTNRAKIWVWDDAAKNVKSLELTPAQADEQIGLKYLKWALERRPGSEAAQTLFLTLAIERAVERTQFGNLSSKEPEVMALLAAAPANLLIDMLDAAVTDKQTALAYGLSQALGERAEKAAATPRDRGTDREPRPAPLVRALDYADARVQLAAAMALLRIPEVNHGANAKIVKILTRAAAGDNNASGLGRALLVDPVAIRADKVAELLRQVGYQTETYSTGRDLVKRINRASDFDLIVIDRHVVFPQLEDLLAQVSANIHAGQRPILVVASPDQPVPVSMETLLLRLAVLVAVSETSEIVVPPPYEVDRRKTKEDNEDLRKQNIEFRDAQLMRIAEGRIARMRRITNASNLGVSRALDTVLDLRLPQLALAVLIAEYQPTAEFAPTLFRDLNSYTKLLQKQPELSRVLNSASTDGLIRLISQLQTAVTPQIEERYEKLLASIDREALLLAHPPAIDPVLQAQLARKTSNYENVSIIAEPYSVGSTSGPVQFGLAYDVQAAITDPAQRPRSAEEKNAATKMALDWLRRLAAGEQSGYDLKPAVPALRQALSSDELAGPAISALSYIPVAEAQQDLARFAATGNRPLNLREAATDATIRHVQANGKMTSAEIEQAITTALATETNSELKSKLTFLADLLSGKPGDLTSRMKSFQVPLPTPTPAATPAKPDDTKPPVENKQ